MSRRGQATVVSGLPQVNLLPPEVRAARGLKVVKRWLAALVVLTVLLAGGLVAFAYFSKGVADEQLRAANDETERLLAEQEQYAEVPLVLAQLDTIEQARLAGMSTEILWDPYLAAIAATAPEEVSIRTFSMSGATPMVLPTAAVDPLQAPSVATIAFSAHSLTVPDTADWSDALDSVPGFGDAWFSAATITEVEGVPYYTVSATVQVNEQAYAQRFVAVDDEGEEEE